MADIRDDLTYILEAHRDTAEPARWVYSLPSADDVMGARRMAVKVARDARLAAADGDEEPERAPADSMDMDEFAVSLVASCLRSVDNLSKGGRPMVYPAGAAVAERRAFVGTLPYRWIAELAGAVQEDADLDDEEAVSIASTGGLSPNGKGGSVRLPDMSAPSAA